MVQSDVRRNGSELTFEVGGDVDWDAVLTLEPQWEAAVDEGVLTDVTIDLRRVRFIDSTGISLLTTAVDRGRARGAEVRIVKPQAHVFRVFEVTGVDDVLPFVDG
jgi:anti-sigma B factor antagonist